MTKGVYNKVKSGSATKRTHIKLAHSSNRFSNLSPMGTCCDLPTAPPGPALMGLLSGLGCEDVYQSLSKYLNTLF